MGIDWTQVILGVFALITVWLQVRNGVNAKKHSQGTNEIMVENNEKISAKLTKNSKDVSQALKAVKENTITLKKLSDRLSINDQVTVASVRQDIRRMYYELLPYKKISVSDYRALNELYNAYKAVVLPDGHTPNSWADALYNEMSGWERVVAYDNQVNIPPKLKNK